MSVGEEELQPLKIGINGFGRIGKFAERGPAEPLLLVLLPANSKMMLGLSH
jgi:hypothetical protein